MSTERLQLKIEEGGNNRLASLREAWRPVRLEKKQPTDPAAAGWPVIKCETVH
jgi:hypothetical protein